ncbi:hypothetical protein [Cryobacterium roopkundense]|uniref:Uncharacterized protein n=1 Tax=Cryobacterium roopkundense TaxID=1001240 RepID=A0A7W8ZWD9_9MICO|nr:hypothetical protein [Cryobacterium roopkundense]MBB5641463.1 hypothetical protein [Cryobacterium roopkundense]
MTLGNSQPPLTRRQAREAAQALEQANSAETAPTAEPSTADVAVPPAGENGPVEPKSDKSAAEPVRKPRPTQKLRGSAAKSAAAAESAQQTATAVATPPAAVAPSLTAFAPRASDAGAASAVDPATATRSLTRRELRALNAAEAADALELEAEAFEDRPADTARATSTPVPVSTAVPASIPVSVEIPVAPPTPESTSLHPPVGHWSIDPGDSAVVDAAGPTQSLDDLVSLGVGAGGIPTTTNALILPSIPNQGNTSGPLANTGEILITGSFDLPRSLGETGQHPNHFDSADVDQMMDQLDEFGPGENAPVSASRAVSTHASTRNVMTPPKKRGVSLPVVLVVSTAALAVSVGALLFVGHLLQIF